MLEEWVAYRIYGSMVPKQGQVKPEIMLRYLSAMKSYHIDCHFSLETFNTPLIALIIKGGKKLFLRQKAIRLPITKDIPEKITADEAVNIDELNIDTAFKVALAGFLRLGEITYMGTELKKA